MRTDQQLIDVLASVQAAPNGFGPEHAELCHQAGARLGQLLQSDEEKQRALDGSRELLREIACCHLVLASFEKEQVVAAFEQVAKKYPEISKYAPRQFRREDGW